MFAQLHQIANRSVQCLAVIDARAKNDLTVDIDSVRDRLLKTFRHFAGKSIVHHFLPEFRIRRVYRYIQRRQPVRQEPVKLGVVDIGQRNKVAVRETKPRVVVLKIQGRAHSCRQLVDEAKETTVRTGLRLIQKRLGENETELLVLVFLNLENTSASVLALRLDR